MKIEFDPVKSEKNERERGLPFDMVEHFVWETALAGEDSRFPYAETRFTVLGFVGARLHFICFTAVAGGIRVISFRKANPKEVRRYEEEKAADG